MRSYIPVLQAKIPKPKTTFCVSIRITFSENYI